MVILGHIGCFEKDNVKLSFKNRYIAFAKLYIFNNDKYDDK